MINKITQDVLDKHAKWLRDEEGGERLVTVTGLVTIRADLRGANLRGANLSDADLRGADLSSANLSSADLSDADLSGADLSSANLSSADLSSANLRGANLSDADLRGADLSGANLSRANLSDAKNLLNPIVWLADNFDHDDQGYIVYKAIGNTTFNAPDYWTIEAGATIEEVVNPLPTIDCGCGVNFATLKWVKENHESSTIWRCRIRWEWLPGVVVPFNTDGKARCSKLELIETV